MMFFLVISVTVAMIQTAGAYLRYLPFRSGMLPEEKERLWQLLLTWAVFSISLNTVLLSQAGLDVPLYKAVLFFGWLPYFLISLKVVRRPATAHVFVLGMQCLWAFTLHTVAIMVELAVGVPQELGQMSLIHAAVYLLVFAVLLPVERKVFQNLLPSSRFFSASFRWSVALLPVILFIGVSLPIADDQLVHGWRYHVSRFSLPLFFFFVYRAMSIATNRAERNEQNLRETVWMRRQISTLKEYGLLRENSNRQVAALSLELQESYRRLDGHLAAGDTAAALQYIEAQENRLAHAPLRRFSDFPLINAALSIYVMRAEKLGIAPEVRIHLPEEMGTDEHDLAVLISNLLENGVEAEEKQPPGRRFLSVIVEAAESQCVLEIVNLFDRPIAFGENGLPCASAAGHGIGMASLAEFVRKYDAYVDFTQEGGRVQVSMYWEDKNVG